MNRCSTATQAVRPLSGIRISDGGPTDHAFARRALLGESSLRQVGSRARPVGARELTVLYVMSRDACGVWRPARLRAGRLRPVMPGVLVGACSE